MVEFKGADGRVEEGNSRQRKKFEKQSDECHFRDLEWTQEG